MGIKAVRVTEENFKRFGVYTRIIKGEARTGTGGWRAWMTPDVCMTHAAHFGFTKVGGMPFTVDKMERHTQTTELMICGNQPMVLAVADTDPASSGAKAEDIVAFLVEPGEIVVINEGIWHDACRSAQGDSCYYYFLSLETDEKAVFTDVLGGSVDVTL